MKPQYRALGAERRRRARVWARELYYTHPGQVPTPDMVAGYLRPRVGFWEVVLFKIIIALIIELIRYWLETSRQPTASGYAPGEPGYGA